MSSNKKMSIFVLQPNTSHAQWQGEKLNSVYQVRFQEREYILNSSSGFLFCVL